MKINQTALREMWNHRPTTWSPATYRVVDELRANVVPQGFGFIHECADPPDPVVRELLDALDSVPLGEIEANDRKKIQSAIRHLMGVSRGARK